MRAGSPPTPRPVLREALALLILLALEYEQAHAARKGAVGALEAAIAKQEEGR